MHNVGYKELFSAGRIVRKKLLSVTNRTRYVYGIPRGGVSAMLILMTGTEQWKAVEHPYEADLIVDDLLDSGATMERYASRFPHKRLATLFTKNLSRSEALGAVWGTQRQDGEWLAFPWEQADEAPISDALTRILQYTGEKSAEVTVFGQQTHTFKADA